MWFKSSKTPSRTERLEKAGKARARGRRKKALAEYFKLLEESPADHVVHAKIAPILADLRRYDDAWKSFRASAEGFFEKGFNDKAIGVYSLATNHMPRELRAWDALVRLQLKLGRKGDAIKTLQKARRHFRGRARRRDAIRLLNTAFELTPWKFEITYDLACQLAKSGKKDKALYLMQILAERDTGANIRRIRGAILRLSPAPSSAWMWVKAAVAGT